MDAVLDALATHEAAYKAITEATGLSSLVVRPDMGQVIAYASTGSYMVEMRGTADGRVAYRVNGDWYTTAASIPTAQRKARSLANLWEKSLDLFPEALSTKAAYDDAYHAQRNAEANAAADAPGSAASIMREAIERETPAVDPNATEATPAEIDGSDVVLCRHCGERLVANLDSVRGRWGHARTADTTCRPVVPVPILPETDLVTIRYTKDGQVAYVVGSSIAHALGNAQPAIPAWHLIPALHALRSGLAYEFDGFRVELVRA